LEVLGYEYPGVDYSANVGKNIKDVGYRGSRLYPNDPPITPDYTLDALAIPVLGWLKYVKLGKLFKFVPKNKAYSKATFDSFKRQLNKDGLKSILKSKTKIEQRLNEHLNKLEQIEKTLGHASSVEREINTFRSQLEAIDDLLKTIK
jgi:hypothetical protein